MSLIVEKRGTVGWIVFNQPAKRNAINGAMWRGIPQAMAQFDADPEVRCVAFRGAGTEAFASGADISEFDEIRAQKSSVAEYDGLLDQVLHSIQDSRKPSVAMIYGFCMGGGLEVNLLMKRVIPTAALAILPRSGHAINLEEPALFNQLVEGFFHQVEVGRWGPRDPRSTVPSIYGPSGKP